MRGVFSFALLHKQTIIIHDIISKLAWPTAQGKRLREVYQEGVDDARDAEEMTMTLLEEGGAPFMGSEGLHSCENRHLALSRLSMDGWEGVTADELLEACVTYLQGWVQGEQSKAAQ